MSHSSISSSSPVVVAAPASRWSRIRRDGLLVLGLLLALELFLRIAPVHSQLAQRLDPYEHLLAYDPKVPAYHEQLLAQPGYDVWLLGSSYMMTGLNPQQIQTLLPDDLTVQNYGFTELRNFETMRSMVDWLLSFDQPRYAVIGINRNNFIKGAAEPPLALASPYENMFIFRDSFDDLIAGFLYTHSLVYRYGILARNATLIPLERTVLAPIPAGGFTARESSNDDCAPNYMSAMTAPTRLQMPEGLARLDTLIDTLQMHQIPVIVVNLPIPVCALFEYDNYDSYQQAYIDVLVAHLASRDVPFRALDSQFYAAVPLDEQGHYFVDRSHSNGSGAALFSEWTGEFIAEWLGTQGDL